MSVYLPFFPWLYPAQQLWVTLKRSVHYLCLSYWTNTRREKNLFYINGVIIQNKHFIPVLYLSKYLHARIHKKEEVTQVYHLRNCLHNKTRHLVRPVLDVKTFVWKSQENFLDLQKGCQFSWDLKWKNINNPKNQKSCKKWSCCSSPDSLKLWVKYTRRLVVRILWLRDIHSRLYFNLTRNSLGSYWPWLHAFQQ